MYEPKPNKADSLMARWRQEKAAYFQGCSFADHLVRIVAEYCERCRLKMEGDELTSKMYDPAMA